LGIPSEIKWREYRFQGDYVSMPTSITLFNGIFLNAGELQIGYLVTDINHPVQGYWPDNKEFQKIPPLPELPNPRKFTEVDLEFEKSEESWFKAYFTKFLTASASRSKVTFENIKPEDLRVYELHNSANRFKELRQHADARQWISDQRAEGEKIFMIIGIITLENAKVDHKADAKNEVAVELKLSPAVIAQAVSGTDIPGSDILDSGVKISHQKKEEVKDKFFAPDTRIAAVQYRKVEFISRDIEPSKLENKEYWSTHLPTKTTKGGEQEYNVVEPLLQDYLEFGHLGVDEKEFLVFEWNGTEEEQESEVCIGFLTPQNDK